MSFIWMYDIQLWMRKCPDIPVKITPAVVTASWDVFTDSYSLSTEQSQDVSVDKIISTLSLWRFVYGKTSSAVKPELYKLDNKHSVHQFFPF